MNGQPIQPARGILTIVLAALAVSWASIFIRFAEAPPLVIAFYRMVSATVIFLPWALGPGRSSFALFDRRRFTLTVLSGLFLALHFACWISSLSYTTVANSVMLVSSAPIFAAVLGHVFLREKPHPLSYLAIVLALAGGAVIMGGDFQWAPDQLWGDLLAVAGGVMVAAYFMIGRLVQRRVSVFPYIFTTYSSAAVFLGLIVLFAGDRLSGYPPMTWLWLVLLGLVASVIGHSLYNRALRFFKTHVVGVCVLAEPVGATILAYLLLAETPPWYALFGAGPIFCGVAWVFWLERER
ncbi:DMT family transporter [Candidatus Zixiibacteriota bacterium]